MNKRKNSGKREIILSLASTHGTNPFKTADIIGDMKLYPTYTVTKNERIYVAHVLRNNGFTRKGFLWTVASKKPSKKDFRRETKLVRKKKPVSKRQEVQKGEIRISKIGESIYAFITDLKVKISSMEEKLEAEKSYRKELVTAHRNEKKDLEGQIVTLMREKKHQENVSAGKTVKLSEVTSIRRLERSQRKEA